MTKGKHSGTLGRRAWLLLLVSLLLMTGLLLPSNLVTEAQAPEPQEAPTRPAPQEPPPPGTGFIPPEMDLSYLTGQEMPEGVSAAAPLPGKWDWRTMGKVTSPKAQGTCGCCYAFAAVGNVESKLLIDNAGTYDLSENNAKECSWGDPTCGGGNYKIVANLFSQKGTVLDTCDPYVASDVACKSTCPYQQTLLGWGLIAGGEVPSTDVLKAYVMNSGPIDTGMYAGAGDAWYTKFQSYDGSYTLHYAGTEDPNHDVLIVGWDDSLTHAGGTGAWIVKNSWGTGWGGPCGYGMEGGYFTIAYGSAKIGEYSSFMYDWQPYDNTGGLMYYDEAGWTSAWGYGNTTGWGLAKFIPASDTPVTRVEFWTTDKTTDVDVYIYDDFDGTTLSNKLGEKLNNSFNEAGYHSVALDSPLAVTSGDDVIAVVKFTNATATHPIPVDGTGPHETARTYKSYDGSDGSWTDLGGSNDDVAIRLRTARPSYVSIAKIDNPDPVEAGGLLTYTLTIANSSPGSYSNLVITDAVPDNTTFSSASDGGTLVAGNVVNWTVGSLASGASINRTLVVSVSASLAEGQIIANTTYGVRCDQVPTPIWGAAVTTLVGEPSVYLPIIQRDQPPQPTYGRLKIINETGGILTFTLSGLGTKTFGPGTSYWEDIPAGTYNYTIIITGGQCPGTLSGSITISAGETLTGRVHCGAGNVSMTEGE